MAKAAGAEKQDGKDGAVIGGVDERAGGQRLGPQAAPPQSTRLTPNSTARRRPGMGQLIGMDQGKRHAGEGAGERPQPAILHGVISATPLIRGGEPCFRQGRRPRNQSQVEASDGNRKPRKASSSNRGAIRVPNSATIQTSPGVRKKSSMGSVLGMGRKFDSNCTTRLKATPPASKRNPAAAHHSKIPAASPPQTAAARAQVKTAHTMAPGDQVADAMLGISTRGSRSNCSAVSGPIRCRPMATAKAETLLSSSTTMATVKNRTV